MFLKIQMYGLLIHDLNLHLDIYPKDKEIYELFHKYTKEYLSLTNKYQELYSPLLAVNSKFDGIFTWVRDDLTGGMK
jgi:hypothetical protein